MSPTIKSRTILIATVFFISYILLVIKSYALLGGTGVDIKTYYNSVFLQTNFMEVHPLPEPFFQYVFLPINRHLGQNISLWIVSLFSSISCLCVYLLFNYSFLSYLIVVLSIPLPFNLPFNFLLSSWGSSLSVSLALISFFLYRCSKSISIRSLRSLIQCLASIFLISSVLTHSTPLIIFFSCLGVSLFISTLRHSVRLRFPFALPVLITSIFGLITVTLTWSHIALFFDIVNKLDEYGVDSLRSSKPLFDICLKIAIFGLLEFLVNRAYRRKSRLHYSFFLYACVASLLLAFVGYPIISDRILNCIYLIPIFNISELSALLIPRYFKSGSLSFHDKA